MEEGAGRGGGACRGACRSVVMQLQPQPQPHVSSMVWGCSSCVSCGMEGWVGGWVGGWDTMCCGCSENRMGGREGAGAEGAPLCRTGVVASGGGRSGSCRASAMHACSRASQMHAGCVLKETAGWGEAGHPLTRRWAAQAVPPLPLGARAAGGRGTSSGDALGGPLRCSANVLKDDSGNMKCREAGSGFVRQRSCSQGL